MPKTYLDPATGEEISAPSAPSVGAGTSSTGHINAAKVYLDPATGEEMSSAHADVRTQIANRVLNPPASAHGDPHAKPASAFTRFLHGVGVPTSMAEVKALGEHLDPMTQLSRGNLAAIAGPAGIAGRDILHTLGSELGDQAGQAADAYSHGDLKGGMKHSLGAAVPFIGPPAADGNVAGALGRGAALTSGPAIDRVPVPLRAAAESQYGKVFGSTADAEAVRSVVPKLIDEGVRTSNPRVDLTRRAANESTSADAAIDRAAADPSTPPLSRNTVLSQIEDAKQQYLNKVIAPDQPYSSIKRVGGKFAGGKWRQQANPNVSSAVPAGPQAESAISDLNAQADIVRSNASKNATLDPVAARRLQSANPDAHVMNDALQSQLNANPDIARASSARTHWDTVNELAAEAPANKPLVPAHTGMRALGGAIAGKFAPGIGLTVEALNALPVVYRFMTSPAWRTTSALVKARIADLIRANDVAGAAEVVARVGELEPQRAPVSASAQTQAPAQTDDRSAYLQSQMTSSPSSPTTPAIPQRRRPGMQPEFPSTADRDENDALFMRRTDPQTSTPLQFPVPTPPSLLLPEHFTNARNVRYGGPLAGYTVPGEPHEQHANGEIDAHGTGGLYGGTFNRSEVSDATHTPNNILISAKDAAEPGTYAHEVNHAIYEKDLTPAQRQLFDAKVDLARVERGAPESVKNHAWDADRATAAKEVFGELGAQYMLNPTEFRARYPEWYGMLKKFYGGKEYVNANANANARSALQSMPRSTSHLKQNNP